MLDLVEKYFQADLTDVEQDALSEALLNSDEAALAFEAAAKEAYFSYGFPEPKPRWPDPPGNFIASKGAGPWLGPSLSLFAVAIGIAALLWWGYSKNDSIHHLLSGMFQPKAVAPLSLEKEKNTGNTTPSKIKRVARHSEVGESTSSKAEEKPTSAGKSTGPEMAVGSRIPEALLTQKPVVPFNADQNPSRNFSLLSVAIGQSKSGVLSVRVLDLKGMELVGLYRGLLGKGNWVFEWDGRLTNGKPAPAGYYQIEVRSGSFIQHKNIRIQ